MQRVPAFLATILLFTSPFFAHADTLPQWYRNLLGFKNLEANFVQQSESKIFGTLEKSGHIQISRPGKLRIAYEKGLMLISDGNRLVQYDAQTRTAHSIDLERAVLEVPLLRLMVDPKLLDASYHVRAHNTDVLLEARQKGLPSIKLTGNATQLQQVSWQDPSGARQVMTLKAYQTPASLPNSLFSLKLPDKTRWLNR